RVMCCMSVGMVLFLLVVFELDFVITFALLFVACRMIPSSALEANKCHALLLPWFVAGLPLIVGGHQPSSKISLDSSASSAKDSRQSSQIRPMGVRTTIG